ncbi:MAG: YlbF family regulator [Bacilli bacterium]|nr:YlbF family regulator [Bacilli bacterium]
MNDKVVDKAKEVRKALEELPEVQEYLKLKDLLEHDESLKEMRNNIARLKKENKIEERDNLLKIYHSHPLVNNFYLAKEEVKSILLTIQSLLED